MQRRSKKAALEQVRLEVEETKSGMGAGYKKCTYCSAKKCERYCKTTDTHITQVPCTFFMLKYTFQKVHSPPPHTHSAAVQLH